MAVTYNMLACLRLITGHISVQFFPKFRAFYEKILDFLYLLVCGCNRVFRTYFDSNSEIQLDHGVLLGNYCSVNVMTLHKRNLKASPG